MATRAQTRVYDPQRDANGNPIYATPLPTPQEAPTAVPRRRTGKPNRHGEWKQEPATFGGLKWGASLAEAKAAWPSAAQYAWAGGPQLITDDFEVGTVTTQVRLFFRENRLVKVDMSFPTRDFKAMKEVYIEKYGPPTETRTIYGDPEMTWHGKVIELLLARDTDVLCRPNCRSGAMFTVIGDQKEADRIFREQLKRDQAEQREKRRRAKDAF
jgi:hypothetical protein